MEYKFNIWMEDDCYLANITMADGKEYMTQGRTSQEIFEMVADCIMTYEEVPISKWNVFWHRLLKLL